MLGNSGKLSIFESSKKEKKFEMFSRQLLESNTLFSKRAVGNLCRKHKRDAVIAPSIVLIFL